jgi:hypothetical protein
VDAICIDQDNNKEKANQISIMAQIFQHATYVIAYLGPEKDGSDLAVETLLQIRTKEINPIQWPEDFVPYPSWVENGIPYAEDEEVWWAIGALFSREWFRRVWIIQEVVAAADIKVVCGHWYVDWVDLFNAIEVINRKIESVGGLYKSIEATWHYFHTVAVQREWEVRNTRWTLIYLLETFRYARATEKRDRFFALLGFAADGREAAFAPDYEKSFEVIVRQYAYRFVEKGRVMELLYHAGLGSACDGLPSWIPDWTIESQGTLYESSSRGVICQAAGSSLPEAIPKPEAQTLEIQGIHVDQVRCISEYTNIPESWRFYFYEVNKMVDSLPHYHQICNLDDLKWIVPIADASHPEVVATTTVDLQASYEALVRSLEPGYGKKFPRTSQNASPLAKRAQNYINALQTNLRGWRFLVTEKGYVGVVPNHTRVGDVISIFSGGAVPFLLRKTGAKSGEYQLVGECYIYGIMRGEAFNATRLCRIVLH